MRFRTFESETHAFLPPRIGGVGSPVEGIAYIGGAGPHGGLLLNMIFYTI
jgi:hypothetical protein